MGRLLASLLILSCFSFLQVLAQRQSCSSEGSVSLRSGTSASSITAGRVEYCFSPSGEGGSLYWAVVCNSTFQLNEAHVTCRSRDVADAADAAAYTTLSGVVFSQTDLTYQVQVDCTGYETSLQECTVTEVTPPIASSCLFASAGVSCNTEAVENSVILAGSGRDAEGYVMIFRTNSWLFLVAASGFWTDTHAGVVCRQLGYSGGVVPSNTVGYSQPISPTRYQANFQCSSSAEELSACVIQNTFSQTPILATASCTLSGSSDGTLVNSASSLQVVFDGRTGSVCSSGFSSQDANVACQQLGFPSSDSSRTVSSTAFASRPRYLSDLACTGTESSLVSCTHTEPPGAACSTGTGVVLTCEPAPAESLSEGAIAAIVVPIILIMVIIILVSVYHKQIQAKLTPYKNRLQTWWNNLSICPSNTTLASSTRPSSRPAASSTQRPSAQPAANSEQQRTAPVVREPEPTRVTEPAAAASSSAARPKEPRNPQFSAEAPPTYRDADQFEEVIENQEAELEKPPPYIDPNPDAVPSAPPAVGEALFYPPSGPAYPAPTYPPVGPAYPPTYPPTDPAYPPPPPGAYAYPLQPPQ